MPDLRRQGPLSLDRQGRRRLGLLPAVRRLERPLARAQAQRLGPQASLRRDRRNPRQRPRRHSSAQEQSAASKQHSLDRLIADAVQPAIVERWLQAARPHRHLGRAARPSRLRLPRRERPVRRPLPRRRRSHHRGRWPAHIGATALPQRPNPRRPAQEGNASVRPARGRRHPPVRRHPAARHRRRRRHRARRLRDLRHPDVGRPRRRQPQALLTARGRQASVRLRRQRRNFTGQAAAYTLAERLAKTTALKLAVMLPDEPGTDWNDALAGRTP